MVAVNNAAPTATEHLRRAQRELAKVPGLEDLAKKLPPPVESEATPRASNEMQQGARERAMGEQPQAKTFAVPSSSGAETSSTKPRVTKSEFMDEMRGKSVSVGALSEDPRVPGEMRDRLRGADVDGDGRINSEPEMQRLWQALDATDRNGSGASIAQSKNGALTSTGKALAAIRENAKDARSETLKREDFENEMNGQGVSVGALLGDDRLTSRQKSRMQAADLDRDGKISGTNETRAMWQALDDVDKDGSRDTIAMAKDGKRTRCANGVDAVRELARPTSEVPSRPPLAPGEEPSTQPGQVPVKSQYKPGSPEQVALFKEAARRAGLPESWATSPGLQNILRRESDGIVGRPNYTYGSRAKDPSKWASIHDELKNGRKTAKSSATGLGQLLLANVDKYYPSGRKGIGNPVEEAIGMMKYIKDRYGTPERAWAQYGKRHEGY